MGNLAVDPRVRSTSDEVNHTEDDQVVKEAFRTLGDEEPVDMEEHEGKDEGGRDGLGAGRAEADEELHEEGATYVEEPVDGEDDGIVFDSDCVQVVRHPHHQIHSNYSNHVEVSGQEEVPRFTQVLLQKGKASFGVTTCS